MLSCFPDALGITICLRRQKWLGQCASQYMRYLDVTYKGRKKPFRAFKSLISDLSLSCRIWRTWYGINISKPVYDQEKAVLKTLAAERNVCCLSNAHRNAHSSCPLVCCMHVACSCLQESVKKSHIITMQQLINVTRQCVTMTQRSVWPLFSYCVYASDEVDLHSSCAAGTVSS
jgi:hypothetical protein